MTDFLTDFDDLDFIKDEEEWERRTGPRVIEGRANLGIGDEPSWSRRLDHDYHPDCGYQWRLHDSSRVGPPEFWPAPFGCPPENVARAAFGDQ